MLLSVFRANYAFISLLLVVFVGVLWLIPFTAELDYQPQKEQVLQSKISFLEWSHTALLVLGLCATICQAIVINKFFNVASILSRVSSLPGLVFVIVKVSSVSGFLLSMSDVLLLCLLIGGLPLLKIKRENSALSACFFFGFMIGVGTLFYTPAAVLLILPWVYLIQIRPFNIREYLSPFLGFCLTMIFLVAYQTFAKSGYINISVSKYTYHFLPIISPKEIGFLFMVTSILLVLMSSLYLLRSYNNSTVHFKNLSRSLNIHCALLLLWAVLCTQQGYGQVLWPMLAFCAALLLPFYLQEPRRPTLQNILFHFWMVLIIVQYYL